MDDAWYDLTDPLDPLNPMLASYWSDWDCPECSADGPRDELIDGRCPHCDSAVQPLG